MAFGYENIVDRPTLVWLVLGYLVHLALVFTQAGLAVFLIASGAHGLRTRPLRRQGNAGLYGGFRVVLGVLLLLPFLLGVSFWISLLACLGALGLLLHLEGVAPAETRRSGRFTRRAAIAFAAAAAVFMLWEREDNIALGIELLTSSQRWRSQELAWQTASDPNSPKVGDLAPDFELQDPSGTTTVRLSDFRGKRPVALVFGSYTWPPFSNGTVRLKEIYEKYRGSIEFLVVYVEEAHPTGSWWLGRTRTLRALHAVSGSLARIDVKDPVTLEQRREVAASCHSELLDGIVPLYVDSLSNRVNDLYTGRPTRIYFIGKDGRVVHDSGIGPFGFSPDRLELVIEEYLAGG